MTSGIAIVGLACRYPGAASPAELWENVLAGRRAFRRLPAERLRLADYFASEGNTGDSIYSTEAAVLEGYEFDRVRFKVTGTSYRSADLAHWLALDVAAQALADAGLGGDLPRERTGVVVGNTLTGEFSRAQVMRLRWPYVRRVTAARLLAEGWGEAQVEDFLVHLEEEYKRPFAPMTEESLAGGLSNTIAGRIANHFDLGGGGYTVDGACSSSLLAVCQAATALIVGDLDLALAGGVDLSLDPFELVGFARTGALARGEMRVYDARSDGFIPGEGAGFAVLMREEEARAAGRRIYAVIRGWGISSDGAGGITRPEAAGQLRAFERAYARAGRDAGEVTYFEGHGTGTALGDATELEVLTRARQAAPAGAPAAVVGSVKALIGHTKAAAGAAALIKAALALHHQILPPTVGCEEPHSLLTGEGAKLRALDRAEPWPADRPLLAGVSAMGFGGINTHLVLGGEAHTRRTRLTNAEERLAASPQDAELVVLAAGDREQLATEAVRLAELAAGIARAELTDLAARQAQTAGAGAARAAVVASTPAELALRLRQLAAELGSGRPQLLDPKRRLFLATGAASPAFAGPRLGLLFPGQAAPTYFDGGALGRRLPAVAALYGRARLTRSEDRSETAIAQPAIIAAERAGLLALEQLGIEARLAVGHSLGELAALSWAGAFDEGELLALARARGAAMAELGDRSGAMASLGAPAALALPLLSNLDGVAITGFNAPGQTVISGPEAGVEIAAGRARERGLQATRLKVSHAFHSPLVEAAAPRFAAALAEQSLRPLARRVFSTVTGTELAPDADLAALLRAQITAPVRFIEAVEAAGREVDLWLEVGPGSVLGGLAEGWLEAPVISLDAGGSSLAGWLAAAGAAFALGAPVDLHALFADRFTRPFDPAARPRFLVNPCELAPLPGIGGAIRERPAEVPAPSPKPAPEARGGTPLEVVRAMVAARAELPLTAVEEGSRLLSDLHLNSISVGQLVAEAARQLGLAPPASPTDFANATVGQVAEALAERRALGTSTPREALPAGVDAWVRAFTIELRERPLPAPSGGAAAGAWELFGPPDHPLRAALAGASLPGSGALVLLPPAPAEPDPAELLAAAQGLLQAPDGRGLLVVGRGGGGFARTLHREQPQIPVTVVDLPLDDPRALDILRAELAHARDYREACYDRAGLRRVPVLRHLPLGGKAAPVLGPGDVVAVSGGGKGIAAECALALARDTGAKLALLGRSAPETDEELSKNLERFRAAGAEVRYYTADVTDEAAVRSALARAAAELGAVTGLLHGAGRNTPCLVAGLSPEAFTATLAPKVRGLEHLLAAVEPARLKLLLTFGSIIAEIGMPGEADYATANEWLAQRLERFAGEHPGCRVVNLAWSVWSGVGMGERLGTIESLLRDGVTPIPPGRGVELFSELLAAPLPAVSVVVTGRFGDVPTLAVERPELPFLRFLEKAPVFLPGVELVAEAEIAHSTDPYLADHAFHGEPLFPAVLGLEAMAQVARALLGRADLPTFEQVRFERPVVVAAAMPTVIRIAALAHAPERVEVVLRASTSGFQADCFRAVCVFGGERTLEPSALTAELGTPGERLALDPATELYGGVLFHQGCFRRLAGYDHLTATSCAAEIAPDGKARWFGSYLPQELLLGDPAARDAAIHGLQPSIPHATILPTGVERIVPGALPGDQPLRLIAKERQRRGDTFLYDLEILSEAGELVERWEGLELRAIERLAPPAAWPVALLGPYLERRLQELVPEALAAVVVRTRPEGGERDGREALRALLGARVINGHDLHHRPDGQPEAPNGAPVSLAYAPRLVLAVTAGETVGCDLEPVVERSATTWGDLLGQERARLAERIAADRAEDHAAAATRIWAAAECLKKAAALNGAPLVLGAPSSSPADGWLVLRSGPFTIGTLVAPVQGQSQPLAFAVLTRNPS